MAAHLQASNYLSDWIPAGHHERLASAYAEGWLTMSRENGHLLLLQGAHRSIGSVAGNRVYPKTWLVHHLGIDREARAVSNRQGFLEYSRELYSAIIYMVQHLAEAEYLAIWVEENKRWNEMLYRDFVRSYSVGVDSLLTRNTVYRFLTGRTHHARAAGDVEVCHASENEAIAFAGRLAGILPPIEVDALAYGPSEIGLTGFGGRGYERTRTIYLSYRRGELVAGMIAETGGEGTNVFGLLNTCRIIPLGEGALHPDVKRALLTRAIEHYRAAGKLQLIFFDDLSALDPAVTGLGFEHVSAGVRWIANRRVLPAWLSYVDKIFKIQLNKKQRINHERNNQHLYKSRAA